ncbi:hypothetical protein OF83DRAFT_1169954 [Amylostereum chailletii]|nr:hypothetical protein OF83DRAFT_1169954 [Amylostereum chailletii]
MPDDPRDASREVKRVPPLTWRQDSPDALQTSGMFLAGLIMVTRNRILAWPSLLAGISAFINQHPLRTKEGGSPPIGNLLLAAFALIASYVPVFVKSAPPADTVSA